MDRHESSVNFQNLIRDLAEMYPQEVAEVVIVELIANSLDAGATRISIDYNLTQKTLIVADNGQGMDAAQFDQYHDFAAGLKTRGTGIGFAGVGAKISFNIADRVITETVGRRFKGGSDWYMESNKKLVWDEIRPAHLSDNGTRVEVRFRHDITPSYTTRRDLVTLLQRNYLPLLDVDFLKLYEHLGIYSNTFRFIINGEEVSPGNVAEEFIQGKIKKFFPERGGKMVGFGVLGLAEFDYPLGQDICGVLLCTHGKVIKADLFNQFPGTFGPRLFGLVEIRDLVNFLTTSKTDFIRGRGRLREFERLYDPVRQEFKTWLGELGVQQPETGDSDEAARLEREIRQLSEQIPELSEFFGFRSRVSVLQHDRDGETNANIYQGADITFPDGDGTGGKTSGPLEPGDERGESLVENQGNGTTRATPISRRARQGPMITFDSRADRIDLAWVDGNSVVINSGHPSYRKANANPTARRIHSLFAIASAVQRFNTSEDAIDDIMFMDRMMAAWGEK